jgi:hypothetical protein
MPPLAAAAALKAVRNAPTSSVLSGKDKRIGNYAALGLIFLALFFDLLQMTQLIPLIGLFFAAFSPVITILAYMVILLVVKGFFRVEILGGRQVLMRCGGLFGSLIVEFIPLMSAIPATTPGVVALIVATRLEDAGEPRLVPNSEDRGAERIAVFEAAQARRLSNEKFKIQEEIRRAEVTSEEGERQENPVS